MGIQGMHQYIRPYTRPAHLSTLAGRRVGCDGFAWLHRGAISCAQEMHTKAPGRRWWELQRRPPPYITFCMKRVRMMVAEGITPVVSRNSPPLSTSLSLPLPIPLTHVSALNDILSSGVKARIDQRVGCG
jgi:exonuclease-1